MTAKKTLICIPTYNEAENVELIFSQIKALNLTVDLLFIDDNSPDGTGAIIDKLVQNNSNTFVIHRPGKLGIGTAHLDGIKWAYKRNYEILITMDCDLTHSPACLPDFIKLSGGCDIVVGSRYIEKNSLENWEIKRKILTVSAHFMTKTLLRMPYDATGAFRLYSLKKIPARVFDLVSSQGYSFFFESLYILHLNGYKIKELPINLPARAAGHSKMNFKDGFNSLKTLIKIYLKNNKGVSFWKGKLRQHK